MAKLDELTLRVMDPERQRRFYVDVLGMQDLGAGRVGYADKQVALRFVRAETPYRPEKADLYWKIAISVPDIALACRQLRKAGVTCSEPHQFEDVGYLAHFTDPEGFSIELIDHAFENERGDAESDPRLLGGGAHLSLVTLRVAEVADVEPTLLAWGMRKLSVQPLTDYGFTLHFYAFTEETPPEAEFTAVANRTWVYQRDYTVLELQHVAALEGETGASERAGGYAGLAIASGEGGEALPRLGISWVAPRAVGED